eukprot:1181952-Prorocentrum_minimum.AAC.4
MPRPIIIPDAQVQIPPRRGRRGGISHSQVQGPHRLCHPLYSPFMVTIRCPRCVTLDPYGGRTACTAHYAKRI